jgi:molybdate transport system regulatory protein
MSFQIQTRSNLTGVVKKITKGATDSEVTLTLKTGEDVTGFANNDLMAKEKIEVSKKAIVWVLAANVALAKDKSKATGNVLAATVSRLAPGSYNTIVELKLSDGFPIAAELTNEAAAALKPAVGDKLFASFLTSVAVVDAKRPANAWAGLDG